MPRAERVPKHGLSVGSPGRDLEASILDTDNDTYRLALAGTRQEADIQGMEEQIKTFLEQCETAVDEAAVMKEVEGRTGLIRSTLRQLVLKNQVQRTGDGRRGSPYLYSRFLIPTPVRERENESLNSAHIRCLQAEVSRSQNHHDAPSTKAAWEQEIARIPFSMPGGTSS